MNTSLRPAITLAVALLIALTLPSCNFMKAGPVAQSAFLTHAKDMKEEPKHSPFQQNWSNPSSIARDALAQRSKIFITPVTLDFLRPVSGMARPAPSTSQELAERKADCQVLANYSRQMFAEAFRKSKSPRYQIAEAPSKDSLTLELALVEVNPNTFAGGFVRTAINAAAVPGVDSILAKPFKGNTAIEGRLRDSKTGEIVYEFADNEESKSPLIFAFRDFMAYGQAREAIEDWAEQFEELTRTPKNQRVGGSAVFKILPW